MNKLIGGIALLLLVGATGSSARADGSWCVFYDASTYNCGFNSFEQCRETAKGDSSAWCRPNPFKDYGGARQTGRKVRTNRY